jgi:amino acid adenylation domain-containing protein
MNPASGQAATGDLTLLGGILRHAQSRPGAPALEDDSSSLTYGELYHEVKAMAAGLTAAGLARGDRVGLWLGNSTAFVTSALACLWAGMPFVPLPVGDPPARVAHIVEDCDPRLVIVGEDGDGADPALAAPLGGRRTLTPAQVRGEVDAGGAGASTTGPAEGPERDAYIIYTSGTTGIPKGARIPERAFRRAVVSAAESMDLSPSTRTLCVSSFHFDGSYGAVFPTLVAGGSLVIPKREDLLFLKRFFSAVLEESITHSSFSPSYLRLLLAARQLRQLAGSELRTVSLGGEECHARDIAALWDAVPGLRVFNRYGPTETTIAVTNYEVTPEDVSSGQIPIGRPTPGVNFWLVSPEGTLIENAHETGELLIGGEQLMLGYWGDEALTARVLAPDIVPGGAVYRTGDLVYRNDDDLYYYEGRLDDVVKRNGVRISLGEVANVFRRLDGVRGATCLPIEVGGSLGIAAFVEGGASLTTSYILDAAKPNLTDAMWPDEVFILTSFPTTSAGKVDRQQLLALRRPSGA